MSRVEQLQKLVQVAPNDPLSHYGLGLEYINLQQWSDAVAAFDAALRNDAKYSVAYYHKARAQIGAGKSEDACDTLRAGMEVAQSAGDWHAQSEMQELLDATA